MEYLKYLQSFFLAVGTILLVNLNTGVQGPFSPNIPRLDLTNCSPSKSALGVNTLLCASVLAAAPTEV
jgi:hypothetical protein